MPPVTGSTKGTPTLTLCLESYVEIPVVGVLVGGDLDDALAPRRLKRFPVHGGG